MSVAQQPSLDPASCRHPRPPPRRRSRVAGVTGTRSLSASPTVQYKVVETRLPEEYRWLRLRAAASVWRERWAASDWRSARSCNIWVFLAV
jgi:hypothetical protein